MTVIVVVLVLGAAASSVALVKAGACAGYVVLEAVFGASAGHGTYGVVVGSGLRPTPWRTKLASSASRHANCAFQRRGGYYSPWAPLDESTSPRTGVSRTGGGVERN